MNVTKFSEAVCEKGYVRDMSNNEGRKPLCLRGIFLHVPLKLIDRCRRFSFDQFLGFESDVQSPKLCDGFHGRL